MGCSYVERGTFGFWADDESLRALMLGMAEGVDVLPDPPAWLREARDEWRRELGRKKTIGVVLDLETVAMSIDRVEILAKLAAGEPEVVDAFRQLLNGEWSLNAGTSPVLPRTSRQGFPLDLDPERAMIFLCWVRLEDEQYRSEPGESTIDRLLFTAWESKDARVQAAWEALTRPGHLSALEKWYAPAGMNPTGRASTEAALRECRARRS